MAAAGGSVAPAPSPNGMASRALASTYDRAYNVPIFPTEFNVACTSCRGVSKYAAHGQPQQHTLLVCPKCPALIKQIDVSPWEQWIRQQYERKKERPSNKQNDGQSEEEVSFMGLAGELAAVLLLAPRFLPDWSDHEVHGGKNRGRDLLRQWTGFAKDVEVKTQEYCDDRRGYLLIRTRTEKPKSSPMTADDVDDAYYVLMHQGKGLLYRFLGWIDRATFLDRKDPKDDPVGWHPGKRHCWGVHHSKLFRTVESLRKGVPARLTQPVDGEQAAERFAGRQATAKGAPMRQGRRLQCHRCEKWQPESETITLPERIVHTRWCVTCAGKERHNA